MTTWEWFLTWRVKNKLMSYRDAKKEYDAQCISNPISITEVNVNAPISATGEPTSTLETAYSEMDRLKDEAEQKDMQDKEQKQFVSAMSVVIWVVVCLAVIIYGVLKTVGCL